MPAKRPSEPQRPAQWSEVRDLPEIAATKSMPRELAKLVSPRATLAAPRLQRIERPREAATAIADAMRPAWSGACARPRRAKLVLPMRMRYRGREVDPLWIWGNDDRHVYHDPDHYPWQCICRVSASTGGGSGVLIGPRHVLTASHCIGWSNLAITVQVHRSGEFVLAESRAEAIWAYTKIEDEPDYGSVDEDYAVIVLADRLGDAFGYMGAKTYHSAWDDEPYWCNIGYPSDVGGGVHPTWQKEKKLDEDELDYGGGRAMTTSADLMRGNSGGPMFGWWGGMPYVVAVVSASGDGVLAGRENYCAGGSDLTHLVNYARTQSP